MFRVRRHKVVSDPVAVVNRFVDAANRHDADGIARCLHPDFESIQPVYPSRNFRGSEQVRRNWQSIFQSEPGFRLSLVRTSATDGTVWVELHGAGKDVEVAGVFIMGVEDELVRWARVYSAVIEQPAVVMEEGDKAPKVVSVPLDPQAEAEELRRMIEAGRVAAMGDTSAPKASVSELESTPEAQPAASDTGDGAGVSEELVSSPAEAADTDDTVALADTDTAAAATTSASPSDVGDVDADSNEAEDAPHAAEAGGDGEAGAADIEGGQVPGGAAPSQPAEVSSTGSPPTDTSSSSTPSPDGSAGNAVSDTPTDDRGATDPSTDPSTEASSTGDDTADPVSPAVAAVHALADGNRARLAQESLRENQESDESAGASGPQAPPDTDPAPVTELDDAARVRAAARAATSKAAGLSAPKPAGPAKAGGRKSGRGGKPPRRG